MRSLLLPIVHPTVFVSLLVEFLLVTSCVTPYQPDTVSSSTALVVEGLITNQAGPYTVKLSRTADYALASLNLLETGALVTISDTLGHQEVLREEQPGVYTTQAGQIQGVTGRSYQVTITTQDGVTYQSDRELLKACPPIDRIYAEYHYEPTALTNDKANLWDVFVDTKDPKTPGDFYRWEWTHYEFLNFCGIYSYGIDKDVGISCCSNCWDITHCYSNCINISSDVAVNGGTISRQAITQITYNSSVPYYVEVKQQLLSRGVYTFFQRAQQQIKNSGGLFDSAPASINGNLHSTNRPGSLVYGYFGAVGESEAYLLVNRQAGQGRPVYRQVDVAPLLPCLACENSAYRTSTKPRWWPN